MLVYQPAMITRQRINSRINTSSKVKYEEGLSLEDDGSAITTD